MQKKRIISAMLALTMASALYVPSAVYGAESEEEWVDTYVETTEDAFDVFAEMKPDEADKRLIVSSKIDEGYGASEVVYVEETDQYILTFDSAEDAEKAIEAMPESVDVVQDKKLTLANLAADGEEGTASSWGTVYLGMNAYRNGVPGYDDTVIVAVLDTGIDLHNGFFDGETIRSDSCDFTESEYGYQDQFGHGSHVAGIIADATPPNVELMVLKVFNDEGASSWSWVNTAIQYAVQHGADVLNLSFGDDTETGNALDAALAAAEQAGVVVVCASGNGTPGQVWYPANLENTVAVANINKTGTLASDSNYGAELDFCAPGVNIMSAGLNSEEDGTSVTQKMSGTSMATPHVAAEFAYLKMKNPDMTAEELRQEAIRLTYDLGEDGWDEKYGYGYIDLEGYFEVGVQKGDVDADGEINITDVLNLKRYLGGLSSSIEDESGEHPTRVFAADIDEDETVTVKDLLFLKRCVSGSLDPSGP